MRGLLSRRCLGAGSWFAVLAAALVAVLAVSLPAPSAAAQDGRVRAWGYNGNGQLGDRTTTDRTTPVSVTTDNSYTTLIATPLWGFHSYAA